MVTKIAAKLVKWSHSQIIWSSVSLMTIHPLFDQLADETVKYISTYNKSNGIHFTIPINTSG